MNQKDIKQIVSEIETCLIIKPLSPTHREYLLGTIQGLFCIIPISKTPRGLAERIEKWEREN